jgi:type IV pilus assembly protein PilB
VVSEFEQLWAPEKTKARKSVDALLLERGVVNEEQLAQARNVAAQTPGKSLAQILQTMNAASDAQILSAVAETMGLEFFTPGKDGVEARAFELLPQDYIKKHGVLPVKLEGKTLTIAMSDPANVFLIDEVKRKTKRDVKIVVTPPPTSRASSRR